MPLKILHTSDLHLGKSLYGVSRKDEFERMLAFILETVRREEIQVLLIAGDIFDTSMPPIEAQAQYYGFLQKLGSTPVEHTVIIAGNHDSPSFLNAPRALVETLCKARICVQIDRDHPEKEVLELKGADNEPYLLVCAVPYIRERDIRDFNLNENETARNQAYSEAVAAHIQLVEAAAFARQAELQAALGRTVPVVTMAHLFTAGGIKAEDDGVRDLFVGNLGHIDAAAFDPRCAYTALGHLHIPQQAAGSPWIQYSGTPLQMGFGEKEDQHLIVLTLDAAPDGTQQRSLKYIPMPHFKALRQIRGSAADITAELTALRQSAQAVLAEIIVTGAEDPGSLEHSIHRLTAGTAIEIVRIKDERRDIAGLTSTEMQTAAAADLDEETVFLKRLEREPDLCPDKKQELLETYHEMRRLMTEEAESWEKI